MNIKNLLLMVMLLFSGLVQASINLGFQIQSQNPQWVDLRIVVSGLGAASAPALSAYDLDIHFDPNQLAFNGAVFGDSEIGNQLDLFALSANPSAAALTALGVLNIFELSLDSVQDLNGLQVDSFSLATLSFNVLQQGVSQLDMVVNSFVDAEGIALSVTAEAAQISSVPLPSAVWLMASGLLVFARGKLRRFC